MIDIEPTVFFKIVTGFIYITLNGAWGLSEDLLRKVEERADSLNEI